jgi:hypothetical protein
MDLRCAECGQPLAEGGVPLAALYVDEDGDEIDADLVFCTPDHLEAWVTRVPSIAVARSGSEALWRGAPATRLSGYLGCFVAVACALAVLLLIAYVVGRIAD